MIMVEITHEKEGAGILPSAKDEVQANATSAIVTNNTPCDMKYLESLTAQIT